jgi:hypothetical protein
MNYFQCSMRPWADISPSPLRNWIYALPSHGFRDFRLDCGSNLPSACICTFLLLLLLPQWNRLRDVGDWQQIPMVDQRQQPEGGAVAAMCTAWGDWAVVNGRMIADNILCKWRSVSSSSSKMKNFIAHSSCPRLNTDFRVKIMAVHHCQKIGICNNPFFPSNVGFVGPQKPYPKSLYPVH